MKFVSVLVLGFVFAVASQVRAESSTFGVEAGVTASRFSPDSPGESISMSSGAMVGLYAVAPIIKAVSFVPEVVYVQKYASRTGTTSADAKIEYIEIPLLAKLPFLWGTYFAEGVALGFPLSVKGFSQNLSNTTSPDVAIVIGGGVDIHKLALEFRYDGGLRQINSIAGAPVQRTRSFIFLAKLHF